MSTNINDHFNVQQVLNSMLDVFPGYYWWKDSEGRYLGASKSVEDTIGIPRETLLGKKDSELPWKEDAELFAKNDQIVMKQDTSITTEENITTLSGEKITLLVTKSPLKDMQGRIIGTLGNAFNITARKQEEMALKAAKEQAEQVNVLKTRFIQDMEHDLRTPCSGIAEMLCILEETESDPEKKSHFADLSKAASQLLSILNGILSFSHIESGTWPIKKVSFNMCEMLESVVALETPSATQKKLQIISHCDTKVPHKLLGDEQRISRIFINLLGNAIKFTKHGFVKAEVQLVKQIDEKHVLLKLIVQDTGIGIPKDKQTTIYERFTRLHPGNEGVYKGFGLGLCIVQQFVKELRGTLTLESEVGTGSTFACEIPFEVPLLPENDRSTCNRKPSGKMKHRRILLVEDDMLSQKIVAMRLKEYFDCQLDLAENGAQAMEFCKNNQYDLILMDLGLPDMSGYEIAQFIRQNTASCNQNTLIVALTAHSAEDVRQHCKEVQMEDFLVKPITTKKIQYLKQEWLPE